jgi:serine/threonine protein kinase
MIKGGAFLKTTLLDRYDNGLWRADSLIGDSFSGSVYKISTCKTQQRQYAALKIKPVPRDTQEYHDLIFAEKDKRDLKAHISYLAEAALKEALRMELLSRSPHIVQLQDYKVLPKQNEFGFLILIRMELLSSLEMALAPLALRERDAAKLGIDICSALELMAEERMIHRNIKPSSIFLSEHGDCKLGDFEIAAFADLLPSFNAKRASVYTAPEIISKSSPGYPSDLYSLGLVMYQALNDGHLFPTNSTKLNYKDLEYLSRGYALPPPANASSALSDIVLKACAFDQSQRYQSASEMKKALVEFVDSELPRDNGPRPDLLYEPSGLPHGNGPRPDLSYESSGLPHGNGPRPDLSQYESNGNPKKRFTWPWKS